MVARLPWHIAAFDHLLEHLSVPERVHCSPESFIPVRHKLPTLDEALEGLNYQLVSFLNVVEYLVAENEIPTIDPYLGSPTRAHFLHDALFIKFGKMKGDWRVYRYGQLILPLLLKQSIMSGSGAVRPSLYWQETFRRPDEMTNCNQTLTNIAPYSRVYE
jgi:hypothetical protein